MTPKVKNKLIEVYDSLNYKYNKTCLKYYFDYNKVKVNIYFDAFDKASPSLIMILSFEKDYYYTPLNITNTNIKKEYLKKIPISILNQLLKNNHLDDFFADIENHILSGKCRVISYTNDDIFTKTMNYCKNKTDFPFWQSMRNVRMSSKTLERLYVTSDISRNLLLEIQKRNMTLVKTKDPKRRKNLTLILNKHDFKLC